MATCDMGYEHADPIPVEPEPVIVAPDPGPNENDVAIAEIEAAARVEVEKLYTQAQQDELIAENERLRGELDGMKETLALLQPPEPEPVPEPVIVAPEPAPEFEGTPAPPVTDPPASSEKKKGGYWDAYR